MARPVWAGGGTPGAEELAGLTNAELYEEAAAAGIPGRSTMTGDALRDALRDALTGSAKATGSGSPRAA